MYTEKKLIIFCQKISAFANSQKNYSAYDKMIGA